MRLPLLLALLASPAFAQDATTPEAPEASPSAPSSERTFQPPEGCTAFLTVQMTSCTVSHHFTCDRDPVGWQRRVDMDEGGITYFGAIDDQTQWMESYHVLSQHSEFLQPDAADPANFDTLLSTGLDTFDFETTSEEIGTTRYVGQDKLTGRTVTIDGVPLEESEYRMVATDAEGKEIWRSAGNEFISREWRMFLSGTGTTEIPDQEPFSQVADPVEFIDPGEPGFLGVTPRHGCGSVLSSYQGPAMSPIPESRG